MKKIILESYGNNYLYLVPDMVEEHIEDYAFDFYRFIHIPMNKSLYKKTLGYNPADFIKYLNDFVFKNEPSVLLIPEEKNKQIKKFKF